ncbi:hypothetical protein BU16DRAFT_552854 [Lophium mytilinum]|uniref:Fungal N-terminal domain-containing protein n=1 Tax=Lophium mytilinum TaxID=390894 RepID=A0A6A6QD67_9PEZI|nr:hypothetical protein BU16DRAFT_552854 [Lophium mytilinum]
MAGIPSIGDILMLSQLAWKIGRAFTAGRKGAPAAFLEVETEVNGLARALKLLAETLFADADDSVLSKADKDTKYGVATILLSCQQTLHDLDSLTDQYQIIKKHRTSGGFAVERSWSDLVLCSYKTMMWTTEGGNIQALRNMLHMHMSTITLTMQALQSKSLSRLENTVTPMAEKIDDIHQQTGDLAEKLEDIHSIVRAIAGETPRIRPRQDSENGNSRPSSTYHLDYQTSQSQQATPTATSYTPRDLLPQRQSSRITPQQTPELVGSELSSSASSTKRISSFSFGGSQSQYASSYAGSDAGSSNGYTSPMGSRSPIAERRPSKRGEPNLMRTPELPEMTEHQNTDSTLRWSMEKLPQPALDIPPEPDMEPVSHFQKLSITPLTQSSPLMLHRSSTSASQQNDFEKAAFRNSAVLCDVRGTLVEYTRAIETDDEPFGVEMAQACTACRICVVRKRETSADRSIRMITSIWAFSSDNTVRFQQKLADGELYVPYSSYFSPEKISVTVPTEVKYHDVRYGSKPLKTAKTSWINYVFEEVAGATLFQTELMGRTLLATFRTEKTLRIHEGLSSVLTYAEQMCGMENLRLWEDEATNAVIATIHFSAHFRNGYLAFYLNSSSSPVRVKDEGGREVKIKGLRVPVDGRVDQRKDSGAGVSGVGEKGARRGSEVEKEKKGRYIAGAKIEFASEAEKRAFLVTVKEVQKTMRELPDLVGV